MEAEKTGIGVGESSSASAKAASSTSSFKKFGDRQVFSVELRPGETTTVSWKRLVKDANKLSNGSNSVTDPHSLPNPIAHPNLESRIAPVQPAEKQMKDEPHPNRFSAVIEKIERLYMGKDSSDDEELDDIPDDDQYDTEDSFIDDAELDEYFEVDNSAIKHDGFFVNRGKLERIEPTKIPEQQQKKRRRKEIPKADGEIDDGRKPNKHVKAGKAAVEKTMLEPEKNSSGSLPNICVSENFEDLRSQNQLNAGTSAKKKSADTKTIDPNSSLKITNGSASASLLEPKEIEKPKAGVLASKNIINKLKDGLSDASHQKRPNKSASQSKFQPTKAISNLDEVRMREKNGIRELPDLNISDSKSSMHKALHMHRKDGIVRPKSSILEKAIRELEKVVAESRPPALDNQEADMSSQAVKRRLPREVKLKLAKVARVEYAISGRITKELLVRLNGILGHLIQLRSLKRNLKVMVSMGLSAKQEKDDRFQQIKKEVVEMIRNSLPSLELKAFSQQAGASDDFQEIGSDEKGVNKRRFSLDAVMEDKICDLYDLYVDGLDEDAGPQIRKLYAELAELWPKGLMDNHGIKRAICRAKERRRALYSRHKDDQEKIKRKKITVETLRVEAGLAAQSQYMRERMAADSGSHALTSASKPVSNPTSVARLPSPSMSGPNMDRPKQEKLKGNSMDDPKMVDGALTKKKVKRKPEQELDETHFRPEKLPIQPGEERHKSLKQATILAQKSSLHPTGLPCFDHSS